MSNSNINKTIVLGEVLSAYIGDQRLSVTGLASDIGMSRSSLANIINGGTRVEAYTVAPIVAWLLSPVNSGDDTHSGPDTKQVINIPVTDNAPEPTKTTYKRHRKHKTEPMPGHMTNLVNGEPSKLHGKK